MSLGADEFYLQIKDLPESLRDEVLKCVTKFTIPIIVDDMPLGSGSLVRIDGVHGILTAEHVVRSPYNEAHHLDYTGFPERFLSTCVADFPHSLTISTWALKIFTTTRQTKEFGPDLAFIALPASPMLSELKARKSFSDLTYGIDGKLQIGKSENGFYAFCGFPREKDTLGPAELGFSVTKGLNGYAFFTGPNAQREDEGHDYYDLGVTKEEIAGFLTTFGGVSGGGLWKFPIFRKAGASPGSEYVNEIVLSGVAFYEEEHADGMYFVRAHGPKSIYEAFLPMVREKLREAR